MEINATYQKKQHLFRQQEQINVIYSVKLSAKIRNVDKGNGVVPPRGRGVLPYISYIGMCRFGLKTGIDFE